MIVTQDGEERNQPNLHFLRPRCVLQSANAMYDDIGLLNHHSIQLDGTGKTQRSDESFRTTHPLKCTKI